MSWWQQTIVRCVLFVAQIVARAEGQDEIVSELKALSNHITTYRRPPSDPGEKP